MGPGKPADMRKLTHEAAGNPSHETRGRGCALEIWAQNWKKDSLRKKGKKRKSEKNQTNPTGKSGPLDLQREDTRVMKGKKTSAVTEREGEKRAKDKWD